MKEKKAIVLASTEDVLLPDQKVHLTSVNRFERVQQRVIRNVDHCRFEHCYLQQRLRRHQHGQVCARCFGSCATLCFVSPRFCQTLVVDMDVPDDHAHRGAARRRRERRLRAFLRHEKLALAMQMATMSHHMEIDQSPRFTRRVTSFQTFVLSRYGLDDPFCPPSAPV